MLTRYSKIIAAGLALLGETPDEIANNLLLLGHKGYKGSLCGCPLSEYFRSLGIPVGMEPLSIRTGTVGVYCNTNNSHRSAPFMSHKLCVSSFIHKFDHDGYPFLDKRKVPVDQGV